MENEQKIKYSIVIPCYNEEVIIGKVLEDLVAFLEKNVNDRYEIIAVDDGSKDKTLEKLENIKFNNYRFYSQPYNKGYGASLKLGVKKAQGEFLIFYDGDGQHLPEEMMKLINIQDDYDMVIGSREKYNGPVWRQPGKKILNLIANYLVNFMIPDLNSGLRLVRKECFNRFVHLYPQGFSLSTTITLAFIKHGYSVKYVPITVKKREGKSSVKLSDGVMAINLVLRMTMLFAPMKIFFPFSIFFFLVMLGSLYVDFFVYGFDISQTTMILFVAMTLMFGIGLLADQLAAIRRELRFL